MQPNPTTVGRTLKQVLVPPGKPVAKEDGFVTPRGADIEIKYDSTGLFYVVFTSGGPKPPELSGRFTDRGLAETAVEKYLDGYWKSRS